MELPTGTVTFLVSDIEGSTRLAAKLGPDWPAVLGEHASLIRKAVTSEGGVSLSTEGDSFFCVFVDPAAALRAAVGVVRSTSSPADAEPHYMEALRLWREIGDESEVANALYNAAFPVAYNTESGTEGISRSRPMLAEAQELYERLGDDAGVARVLWALGAVIWVRGDPADLVETVPYFERSAELSRATGDVFQLGWALRMVGRVLVELGRIKDGAGHLAQAVEVFALVNDVSALTVLISDHAALAIALGDLDAALRLDGATSTLRDSSGANIVDFRSHERAPLDAIAAEMGDRAQQLYDEGAALSFDEALVLMRELTEQTSSPTPDP